MQSRIPIICAILLVLTVLGTSGDQQTLGLVNRSADQLMIDVENVMQLIGDQIMRHAKDQERLLQGPAIGAQIFDTTSELYSHQLMILISEKCSLAELQITRFFDTFVAAVPFVIGKSAQEPILQGMIMKFRPRFEAAIVDIKALMMRAQQLISTTEQVAKIQVKLAELNTLLGELGAGNTQSVADLKTKVSFTKMQLLDDCGTKIRQIVRDLAWSTFRNQDFLRAVEAAA